VVARAGFDPSVDSFPRPFSR